MPNVPIAIYDVRLVHPDDVAQHDPVLVAGHRGEHAVPPLKAVLWVTPHSLAAHSTGTL